MILAYDGANFYGDDDDDDDDDDDSLSLGSQLSF
jgi:hypothetical protein